MKSIIRILLVEDVDEMRTFLENFLNGMDGIQVFSLARNIWEARLELSKHRPDLVLLDEVLPGESSLDFLKEVRKEGIPVLLLTGMAEPEHPLPEGALARLRKPTEQSLSKDRQRFQAAIAAAFAS